MTNKKTLVIGASENPERYSFKAIKALRNHKHDVIALGLKLGKVADVEFITDFPLKEKIDTVTLYVGPSRQDEYYDDIIALNPERVIFNPGTENDEFYSLLKKAKISFTEACTLVLLSIGDY
jgi:uncharacterized protein